MAADQTKDTESKTKAAAASRAGHEIAHHHRRLRKHVEQSMLAKIGRSIKEALIKTEAVILPHPAGKDRRFWD
jgi:hypothetical protein